MEQSDYRIDSFVDLKNGSYMFTYDHCLSINLDGHKLHKFNYITVDSPTRDKAIAGMVALRFTYADEIALINNKLSEKEGSDDEYGAYLAYRDECKLTVDKSLQGHEEVE